MEASSQISKEGLGGQCMKPWEWSQSCRLQKLIAARNVEHLLNKDAVCEWRQSKAKSFRLKLPNTGVELAKPNGNHILPVCSPDAWYGATGLKVFPSDFWSCFGLIPFYAPIPPFRMGVLTLCQLYPKIMYLVFYFLTAVTANNLPWVLKKKLIQSLY